MTERPLVFFHVMKCGGTSVRNGLTTAVQSRRDGRIFELDGAVARLAAAGRDPENWTFRNALLPYIVLAERPALVLGHFRYLDRYQTLLDEAALVTVLREPVDRVVSLYKYRRFKEDVDVPVDMSLEAFLSHHRWAKEGHNYVDTFCGDTKLDPRSDEAIDQAIENLGRFSVVGTTDRLDSFGDAVAAETGLEVSIPVMNTTPAPRGHHDTEVDERALALAREVCEPDRRVYDALIGPR